MERREFIQKSLAGGLVSIVGLKGWSMVREQSNKSDILGFNHLPSKTEKTMNTVLHKATSRGKADHGWLKSRHTFSFASYQDPDRMGFGKLRVLNDDNVQAGKGFGKHPHNNMEIISIPLEGDLEHRDSMNNVAVIKEGDVQVMSAGSGLYHSEFNKNVDKEVKFLQIWVFPNKRNVEPRYDQIEINELRTENEFYQILSPNPEDQGVWIHQNAWFHLGDFNKQTRLDYNLKAQGNGVYVFVIKGTASVNGQALEERDGYGLWDIEKVNIEADAESRLLLMEVPMR